MTRTRTSIPRCSSSQATSLPRTGLSTCLCSYPPPSWTRPSRKPPQPRPRKLPSLKSEEAKAETYRSQYPGSLHFDFTWDEKKGKELGLQQIWHDDKFTYLRGQFSGDPCAV